MKKVLLVFVALLWATLAQAQFADQRQYAPSSSGTANNQTVNIPNYNLNVGVVVRFVASFTNTGATTLSVNGGATKSILSLSSSGLQALGANTIVAGQVTEVVYDGTQFELLSAQNAFSAFPHFANTSAVQAITSTTLYPSIIRDNYAVSGDGGTAWYNLTVGGTCASADNGAQIQAVAGCYVADFSKFPATPNVWGAKGDGVTDDHAAINAALAAVPLVSLPVGKVFYVGTAGVSVPAGHKLMCWVNGPTQLLSAANPGAPVVTLAGNAAEIDFCHINGGNNIIPGPRYSDGVFVALNVQDAVVNQVEVEQAADGGIEDAGIRTKIFHAKVHDVQTNCYYGAGTPAQFAQDGDWHDNVAFNCSKVIPYVVYGYISGTTLTVTSLVSGLTVGSVPGGYASYKVTGSGVTGGTTLTALINWTGGGAGTTYTVSASQTVGSAGSPVLLTATLGILWDGYDLDPCHSGFKLFNNRSYQNDYIIAGAYNAGNASCGPSFGDQIIGNYSYSSIENGIALLGQLHDEQITNNFVYTPTGYCIYTDTEGYQQFRVVADENFCIGPTKHGIYLANFANLTSGGVIGWELKNNHIENVGAGYSGIYVTSAGNVYGMEGNIVVPGAGSAYAIDTSTAGIVYAHGGFVGTGGTGTIHYNTSQTQQFLNVSGFSPVGYLSGAPAIPATTVAQTNGYPFPVNICVSGGTVTALAVGGTVTGLTSGCLTVGPQQTWTPTYSVAPTVKWFGL